MSITYHDIPEGEFVPQSDFRTQESPNGGVTATQSYILRASSLEALVDQGTWAKGKPLSQLDDTVGLQGDRLYLDRTTTSRLPGGLMRVNAFFGGFSTTSSYGFDEGRQVVPTYSLQTNLTELSIMRLPQVKNLATSDKTLIQACIDRNLEWNNNTSTVQVVWLDADETIQRRNNTDQPSATAGVYCEYATKGETTYNAPHISWEKTWDDEVGIVADDITKLGKVDDNPDGNPPTLPGERNWMLSEASSVNTAKLFRNRKSWLASEPGGWEGFLES